MYFLSHSFIELCKHPAALMNKHIQTLNNIPAKQKPLARQGAFGMFSRLFPLL
jgi:hypothetical protein